MSVIWRVSLKPRKAAALLSVLAAGSLVDGCGAPRYDAATNLGKQGIIDQVNLYLTTGDCTSAIDLIEQLYTSDASDNAVRLARASAHACAMGIEFFPTMLSLASANLVPPAIWPAISELFYDADLVDAQLASKQTSGYFATDALLASLERGVVVPASSLLDSDEFNKGSTNVNHRTADSNFYLIMTAIAQMAHTQNRRGDPDPDNSFAQQSDLPWETGADVDVEGCGYVGALLNFLDGVGATANELDGDIATSLNAARDALNTVIVSACAFGCNGDDGAGVVDAGCSALPTCGGCPEALRDRSKCVDSDLAKCAAAGVVRFVNGNSPAGAALGWQN